MGEVRSLALGWAETHVFIAATNFRSPISSKNRRLDSYRFNIGLLHAYSNLDHYASHTESAY